MRGLRERGHEAGLREAVLKRGIPYFGICLGMQFLLQGSEEGNEPGLSFFPGVCGKFPEGAGQPKVPHIGWHDLVLNGNSRLFAGMVEAPDVYFVHSYFVPAEGETKDTATAFCDYGLRFVAALERGNIFACQFHPEKSQTAGMKMIENFLQLQMAVA
jgi:glutamine amidotransferase